ncbi:hypothetical protein [Nostoc sp. UHCC 0251]|uniref:hypothetical protein n=1 Tax=Nostoc sp. UHCC 0251 TaxID=3110240 RepID=UPI002B20F543|nr:hypothetical protein [Nostoc sp. UHCC 0251]MEA5623407.1 hypothetical protein [Nostoc sp. UHCC 0251]
MCFIYLKSAVCQDLVGVLTEGTIAKKQQEMLYLPSQEKEFKSSVLMMLKNIPVNYSLTDYYFRLVCTP